MQKRPRFKARAQSTAYQILKIVVIVVEVIVIVVELVVF